MKRNLIYVNVNDVVYNEGFFEPLDEESFGRLKESIRENGIVVPVVVTEDRNDRGKYILLDGRNRYRAACELGIEMIPAEVIEVSDQVAVILQYDLEICRRHLDNDTLRRKWEEERNYYMESIKKSLKSKILQILKLEESNDIKNKIDSMPLNEVIILYETLRRASSLSQELINGIAKQVAYKIYTVTKDAVDKTPEEIEKAVRQYYEKQLEELREKLRKKDEELFLLEEKLKQLKEEKKKLEEEFELVRKAKKEQLENYIRERTKEYEEKLQELEEQLFLEKARKHDPEQIKKLAEELEEKFKAEIRKKEEEFHKEEAEWRRKINELQSQILNLNKRLEELKEEKEKLNEMLRAEIAEKQRIRTRFDNLLRAYKEVTSERALLNQIKILREQLHLTLQVAYNLDSFNPDYVAQIKRAWEEVEGLFEEVRDYVRKTIIPAGTSNESQSQNGEEKVAA